MQRFARHDEPAAGAHCAVCSGMLCEISRTPQTLPPWSRRGDQVVYLRCESCRHAQIRLEHRPRAGR